jgi:type II secretory pathway component GspD/PulD (secretin)
MHSMKRTVAALLAGVLVIVQPAIAESKSRKGPTPVEPPIPSAKERGIIEFSGDDISFVLRTLARRANLNVVVGDQVKGTVNMRLEDKTPREAIDVLLKANDLVFAEKGGILYVRPAKLPLELEVEVKADAAKPEKLEKPFDVAFAEAILPALLKFHETFLDHEGRPEIARKNAKTKKALYDALMAEGFTKDEALRLVLADQGLSIPNLDQ